MLLPVDSLTVELFLDRDMRHGCSCSRSMPVPLRQVRTKLHRLDAQPCWMDRLRSEAMKSPIYSSDELEWIRTSACQQSNVDVSGRERWSLAQ